MIEIYTLSDSTGVRYVGQSKDAKKRFYFHLQQSERHSTNKDAWVVDCQRHGEEISMEVIDRVPKSLANFKEEYWVRHYAAYGDGNLVNGSYMPSGDCLSFRKYLKSNPQSEATYMATQTAALKMYNDMINGDPFDGDLQYEYFKEALFELI